MAGADIFGHLGICGVDQAGSLTMLLMQHEVIGYVERLMQGFAGELLKLEEGLRIISAYVLRMHNRASRDGGGILH